MPTMLSGDPAMDEGDDPRNILRVGTTAAARRGMVIANKRMPAGGTNMIEIREMTDKEMKELVARVGYGHLGCAQDNRPYVVPIQYIYEDSFVYIYTNDGKKADILRSNPNVCLQVEAIVDNGNWQSVVAEGTAKQVTSGSEAEAILRLMNSRITTPTPAMGITWINNWISAKKEMIFKITIETLSGRAANRVDVAVASAVPARARKPRIF